MSGRIYRKGAFFTHEEYVRTYSHANAFDGEIAGFIQSWMAETPSYEIETSGSTGKPKSITLIRSQMIASARFTGDAFRLSAGKSILLAVNPGFIAGKMVLVRALILELDLIIVDPSTDPLKFVADLSIDFAPLVPYQLSKILDRGTSFENVGNILLGGAPVLPALMHRIRNLTVPVYQSFGMTETVSHVSIRKLNGPEASDVYTATGDASFFSSEDGCLVVSGTVTNHESVETNDLVELIDPQHFRWLGRKDLVINSGGIKMHPELIEEKIANQLFKNDLAIPFFVGSLPHSELGEQLIVLFESKAFDSGRLFTELSSYEKPKKVVFVDNLLRTQSGKIDRKKNIESL